MKVSIGSKLKIARMQKGLKQIDVCRLLNIPNSTLSNYERDIREPDLTTLLKLSSLYETSLDSIIDNNQMKNRWDDLSEFTDSKVEEKKSDTINHYEQEFLYDAEKACFDFITWSNLDERQKNMLFQVLKNIMSELNIENNTD